MKMKGMGRRRNGKEKKMKRKDPGGIVKNRQGIMVKTKQGIMAKRKGRG